MTIATQIQASTLNLQYRAKKPSAYPLKRPWSHGRGYVVIVGIALIVLANLAVIHLHQTWQQIWQQIWYARSPRSSS